MPIVFLAPLLFSCCFSFENNLANFKEELGFYVAPSQQTDIFPEYIFLELGETVAFNISFLEGKTSDFDSNFDNIGNVFASPLSHHTVFTNDSVLTYRPLDLCDSLMISPPFSFSVTHRNTNAICLTGIVRSEKDLELGSNDVTTYFLNGIPTILSHVDNLIPVFRERKI